VLESIRDGVHEAMHRFLQAGWLIVLVLGVLILSIYPHASLLWSAKPTPLRYGGDSFTYMVAIVVSGMIALLAFPRELPRWFVKAWLVFGFALFSRNALIEVEARSGETHSQTDLRRFIIGLMATTMLTVMALHNRGVVRSSWVAARLFVGLGFGALDLVHTLLLHAMYVWCPSCRPSHAVLYMSGVRDGPPTPKSYMLSIASVLFPLVMTTATRCRIALSLQWARGLVLCGCLRPPSKRRRQKVAQEDSAGAVKVAEVLLSKSLTADDDSDDSLGMSESEDDLEVGS